MTTEIPDGAASSSSPAHPTWKSIRAVALPAQHGAWGFLFEPLLLGLLVAASWAGVGLSIAAVGAFLISQPLSILIKDRRKGKLYDRTRLAGHFTVGYMLLASVGLLLTILTAQHAWWFIPLLTALPFVGIHQTYALRNQGRALAPELAGALAFGASAPAVALLGGWGVLEAFALWALLAARIVGSILYVRARLKLEHGKPAPMMPALLADDLALLSLIALVLMGLLPPTVLAGMAVLMARSVIGLSKLRKPTAVKWIGLREVFYGVLFVLLAAVGFWLF